MSGRRLQRAIARLSCPGAVLAADRIGSGFGVYPKGDRRRRPVVCLTASEVQLLQSEGALRALSAEEFVLTAAGVARARREQSPEAEAFIAQHGGLTDRGIITGNGDVETVRGFAIDVLIRRLAAMKTSDGGAWLSVAELDAASQLRQDWAAGELGLVRGSDWTAAPIGSGVRGQSNAQEEAMARRCDARRRMGDALARLAPPLRRVLERVCLQEEGLEVLERSEGWPARSGKLALKFGLAQLAAAL